MLVEKFVNSGDMIDFERIIENAEDDNCDAFFVTLDSDERWAALFLSISLTSKFSQSDGMDLSHTEFGFKVRIYEPEGRNYPTRYYFPRIIRGNCGLVFAREGSNEQLKNWRVVYVERNQMSTVANEIKEMREFKRKTVVKVKYI